MAAELLLILVGTFLVALGVADVFLTILHPDRDGPFTRPLARITWHAAVAVAALLPRFRRELLALAGPCMMVIVILSWIALPILGYALVIDAHLATDYALPARLAPHDFWDALYFSGVAFTTLGFGDITPITPRAEAWALAEGITGFVLGAAAIAFILNVFHGVDRRDGMALRALAETGGTWRGADAVRRAFEYEGLDGLQRRAEGWAIMLRGLHERLYRFQALAFYVRTRGARHEPERMFNALADMTLAVNVIARRPDATRLRMTADVLARTLAEFTRTLVRHHGTPQLRSRMENPQPRPLDLERLRRVAAALPGAPADPDHDPELRQHAARIGVYLDQLERITLWSRWRETED